MKALCTLLLLVVVLYSHESAFHDMLLEYGNSEELYLKTKKESAGNVIVFSRADLDKMQAYTLNDILKTIRMYTLETTNNGMSTLVKSGSSQMVNNPIKIYINSHELNSATLGNALTQYGKMSLYFIDHVEVYQASNPVTFGNEPGDTIIKLYTKEPSKENSTAVQASVDSRSSLSLRAIDANSFDDYTYLLNLDISKNNFKQYDVGGTELSRDGDRKQFYFNFSKKEDYEIEVGATNEEYDSFKGLGLSISDGEIHTNNAYIQASKNFDNLLKMTLSLSTEELYINNIDSAGIVLADNTIANSLETQVQTNLYDFIIEKRFINGSNDLFLGAHIKHKEFIVDTFKSDGSDQNIVWGPLKLDIFMAYLENLYNLNANNLISLSLKVDYYKNDISKSSTENIVRLGYVSVINNDFTLKLFGIHGYSYPTFRQTSFAPNYNINPDLQSTITNTMTAEAIYSNDNTTLTFALGTSEAKDAIIFSSSEKKYVNNNTKSSLERMYIRVEHKFNLENKITFEIFKLHRNSYASPGNGGLIQIFNGYKNFTIYNELVYRAKYTNADGTDMPRGYNYTLGVTYPVSKKLELKLKGENILDKASTVPVSTINIPAMERRALLTMEYTF